jgi:hypothetical protein
VDTLTAVVAALNVALVLPAATVTDGGVVTAAWLSDSATVAPPVGAAFESVTVHVDVPGETIDAGVHASDASVAGIAIAMAPPVAVVAKALPSREAETGPLIPMGTVVTDGAVET